MLYEVITEGHPRSRVGAAVLTIRHTLPERFLEVDPRVLHELLDGPTLIHLPGRREPPLFVSTLLHGNEVTGMLAVQELLRRHLEGGLPRALSSYNFV